MNAIVKAIEAGEALIEVDGGALCWQGQPLARLARGRSVLAPQLKADPAVEALPATPRKALLAALEAWLEAARKAGATDGPTLARAMRGPRLMTRSIGEIQFDANGDLVLDAFVTASARGGRWIRDD